MQSASKALWIPTALLGAAFVFGVFEFIAAPLETGQVYPPYSSLRSDPLGAKALYESLDDVGEVKVSRLFKARETLLGTHDAILVLGVDPAAWADIKPDTLEQYEKLANSGVRLVIAFLPVRAGFAPLSATAVEGHWHLRLAYRSGYVDHSETAIPKRSALGFYRMGQGSEWQTIAQSDGAATVVARAFGPGSVVLVADSYPLSNEGVREEEDAALVATLVGDCKDIVFDESHFGVEDTGSVTTLMRRYRLGGALAILGVVVLLFLWRSTSSFLPPTEGAPPDLVRGRDSQEGFAALLERNLAGQNALAACWTEWKRSAPRDVPESRIRVAEALLAGAGKNTQAAYRAIGRTLRGR